MAKRYSIFLGGNKRHYGMMDVALESELTPFNAHVEYAAHLKRRHFVLPYHYSHYDENHQMWYRENGIRDLEVGDELVINLLAAGTKLNDYVFHNKTAVPGTKFEVEIHGSASDSPVDQEALYTAVDEAKAKLSKAQAALMAKMDDADLKKAVADAKKAVADAEKALMDAATEVVAKFEIDAAQAGFHRFEVNSFLQTNGLVVLRLKEGTMMNTCWSSMLDLVHFDDQHACACGVEPCETDYPDAECYVPTSSSKY